MEELTMKLKVILADVYVLYYRLHAAHWNVIGFNFPQYHDFFGDLYGEVLGSTDDIAEEVRKLDDTLPMSINELLEMSSIPTGTADSDSDATDMMIDAQEANNILIAELREGIKIADGVNEPATGNFLQDRLSAHQKIAWKLRSTITYGN
jgi:starvation-inducible DNA-binding protein